MLGCSFEQADPRGEALDSAEAPVLSEEADEAASEDPGPRQARWFVFSSGEGPSSHGLYATNLIDPSVKVVLSSHSIEKVAWSPDGSRLAYVVRTFMGNDLVVRDMRGATVGEPVVIDQNRVVQALEWSPNGQELLFSAFNPRDRVETLQRVAFPAGAPVVQQFGTMAGQAWWAGNDVIANYNSYYGTINVRNRDRGWAAQQIGVFRSLSPIRSVEGNPSSDLGFFDAGSTSCSGDGYLGDFNNARGQTTGRAAASHEAQMLAVYDRQAQRVVLRRPADLGTSAPPVADLGPTTTCDWMLWAPEAQRFAMLNTSGRVQVTLSDLDPPYTRSVAGDYATPSQPQFSTDGSLLAFRSGRELFTVYTGETVGDLVRINGDLPSWGEVKAFAPSPDGEGIVYVANERAENHDDVTFVNSIGQRERLTQGSPDSGSEALRPQWSSDSRHIVFLHRASESEPLRWHSVDLWHGTPPTSLHVEGGCVSCTFAAVQP